MKNKFWKQILFYKRPLKTSTSKVESQQLSNITCAAVMSHINTSTSTENRKLGNYKNVADNLQ